LNQLKGKLGKAVWAGVVWVWLLAL